MLIILQVLATSLSAMYSELPTVQPLTCDEWSSVTECVRHSVSSLSTFIDCLQFCNSVVQVRIVGVMYHVNRAETNAKFRV